MDFRAKWNAFVQKLKAVTAGVVNTLKTKNWKELPKHYYAVASGVLLALVLLIVLCFSGSVSSDEDFLDLFEDEIAELEDIDKKAWRDARSFLPQLEQAFEDDDKIGLSAALSWAAGVGSKSAVKYLIEEKGITPDSGALANAARCGQEHIVEYLIEEQGLKADETVLQAACFGGQLDVVEYLVEEQGVSVSKGNCLAALCTSKSRYEDRALKISVDLCDEVDVEDLMDDYLDVAEYLVEQGADPKDVEFLLDKTDHPELVAFLRKEAK